MEDKRPVYLSVNPFKFWFPLPALASIFHRITGMVLFLAVGYFLYLLQWALPSAEGFEQARSMLSQPLHQFTLFICLSALAYHLVLGVRSLLLDFHIGVTLDGSKIATITCLTLFSVLAVLIAIWIWGY